MVIIRHTPTSASFTLEEKELKKTRTELSSITSLELKKESPKHRVYWEQPTLLEKESLKILKKPSTGTGQQHKTETSMP